MYFPCQSHSHNLYMLCISSNTKSKIFIYLLTFPTSLQIYQQILLSEFTVSFIFSEIQKINDLLFNTPGAAPLPLVRTSVSSYTCFVISCGSFHHWIPYFRETFKNRGNKPKSNKLRAHMEPLRFYARCVLNGEKSGERLIWLSREVCFIY